MYTRIMFFTVCFLCSIMRIHCSAFDSFNPSYIAIETDRLILRLIDHEDIYDIFECTSDPEMEKLTGIFTLHTNLQETARFIQKHLDGYQKRTLIPWVVVLKPSNKVIGMIMLLSYMPNHFRAEIGSFISRSYWGNGFATEAIMAVLNFAFYDIGLHKVYATVDPRNRASEKVLLKCGFTYEGLLRDHYFLRGLFCDRMMYSMLSSEFF